MAITVQDSFTDVDGTSLGNHNPDIGNANSWIAIIAGLIVDNGKARSTSSGALRSNYNNTNLFSAGYCKADFIFNPNVQNLGVIWGKYTNAQNRYKLEVSFASNYTYIMLDKIKNNVYTSLLSEYPSSVYLSPANIRLETIGTTIKIFINNTLLYSIEDSTPINDGYFGIGSYRLNQGTSIDAVDNFEAGTLASPPNPPSLLTLSCGI